MFIGKSFAIAHIPKTGGHALAVMLHKANCELEYSPFVVEGDVAKSTNEDKHMTFKECPKQWLVGNKKLYVLFRRLTTWTSSVLWHQSKHTFVNLNATVGKVGIRQSYDPKYKERRGFIYLPSIVCHFKYADYLLEEHLDFQWNVPIRVLRMEYLRKDIRKNLNISLPKIHKEHSYDSPTDYWTIDHARQLYKTNPKWAKLEEKVYGKGNTGLDIVLQERQNVTKS